ncbi:MAG: polyprenyl synthetase family protein [Planctomycetota bacterium]
MESISHQNPALNGGIVLSDNSKQQRDVFLKDVKRIFMQHLNSLDLPLSRQQRQFITSGKMLRSKLGAWLTCGSPLTVDPDRMHHLCAATEMVHTAALCHDDVIDGSTERRAQPTLWRELGVSSAILTGDMLLCESIGIVSEHGSNGLHHKFLSAIQQTCAAEITQEIRLRGQQVDPQTCRRVARDKTGSLFAFLSFVTGGNDSALQNVLEEVGYKLGTIYQLADDLIDVVGREEKAGKTLGTDAQRGKQTLAVNEDFLISTIHRLWDGAREEISEWPNIAAQVERYMRNEMRPVIQKQYPDFPLSFGSD